MFLGGLHILYQWKLEYNIQSNYANIYLFIYSFTSSAYLNFFRCIENIT